MIAQTVRLLDLTAEGLKLLPRDLSVFVFTVSGLEDHGPGLPLGTKLFLADQQAQAWLKLLQKEMPSFVFVQMPSLPMMVDGVTSQLSLCVRPHVLRDALVDQCEELKRHGFSKFLVVTEHLTPKTLTCIDDAARIVGRKKLFCVSSLLVEDSEALRSPHVWLPKEHGGVLDASRLKSYLGEAFTLQALPAQPQPQASSWHWIQHMMRRVSGYWGQPEQALVDAIQKKNLDFFEQRLSQNLIKVKVALQEGKGLNFFRPVYRWFPINGSFFKAYLLAGLFFILMLAWAFWSFERAVEF